MEGISLLNRLIFNLSATALVVFSLTAIYVAAINMRARMILKKKGDIYIAIELFFEGKDCCKKDEFIRMTLDEMNEEVDRVVKESFLKSNLSNGILDSKLKHINKYYIIARKEHLFDKLKKEKNIA